MSNYLSNISPDSFSGMVFAFEGIKRSVVIINGPTGCKFYHSATSDNQTIKQFEFDPLNYPEKWYFGQPRVPCTYLDSGDYIYGSREKLGEALTFIRDHVPFDIICIVNSPGAALIGDDLTGITNKVIKDKHVVIVETPGFSSNICAGYETATIELLKQLLTQTHESQHTNSKQNMLSNKGNKKTKVNVLGLSIFHKYHTGDIAEIKRLLNLCGIEINCFLCADCDTNDIKNIGDSELNIVIHPEYGKKTALYLNESLNTPYYICDGPPIGFSATEKMITEICTILGKDASLFINDSKKARARAYSYISRVNSLSGLPKGVEFAVEGTYSTLYSYTNFLVRYFGMILECASVIDESVDYYKDKLFNLTKELGLENALEMKVMETNSEMVFGSGNTIAGLRLRKHEFVGIEISLPTLGYIDIIPKTHLGITGALTLTEQVLNSLIF